MFETPQTLAQSKRVARPRKAAQCKSAPPMAGDREAKMSAPERALLTQMRAFQLPTPQLEYYFAKSLGRMWRSEFGWPERMLLVEVEGGITPYRDPKTNEWRDRGRHLTISGFTADCIKYNAAAMLGYRVLRFTPAMVDDGSAVQIIEEALR